MSSTARLNLSRGDSVSKSGLHGSADRYAAESELDAGHVGLLLGANPHEEGNEQKAGVAEETYQPKQEGHALTDRGGDLRCLEVIHAHGQQGAQDATAIHGERGDQVKRHEQDIHGEQARQEAAGGHAEEAGRFEGAR